MVRIVFVKDALPEGFELLRHAADDETFDTMGALARDWNSGANRFERPGEALVAAYDGHVLAGIGAMTVDPEMPDALRMWRFYVFPRARRRGIGRAIATALLDRDEVAGRLVTLDAPHAEAARFWEALGFIRDAARGHTHVLAQPYAHA